MKATFEGYEIHGLSSRPRQAGIFLVVRFTSPDKQKNVHALFLLPITTPEALEEDHLFACFEDMLSSGLEGIEKPTYEHFCTGFSERTDPEAKAEFEKCQGHARRLEALGISYEKGSDLWEAIKERNHVKQ